MIYLFCFFVYLLSLKNVPRLKIKVHNIQSWMSKWIFKVVKSCPRKMIKRTHLLLNSKMVKSFLGRSNSNFGSKQLTSMVDMPCRIITEKISAAKTRLWVHSTLEFSKLPLLKSENKNVIGEKSKFWNVFYYYKHYDMLIWL